MSLSVTSWFVEQAARSLAAPQRHFRIGGVERAARVLRWPTLRYRAGAVDLGTTQLLLSNVHGTFAHFVDSPASLTTSCELALGFVHPESGEEEVSLFVGAPSHVTFAADGTEVRLQLQGKTRRLSDTVLGTAAQSGGLDFTGSATHPADLAWALITSHGGLSAQADAGNPDVAYDAWVDWRETNRIRDVRVRAYFTGEKAYEALNTLAQMDSRIVGFRGGRLRFADAFRPYGLEPEAVPPEVATGRELSMDPARITNHFFGEADYDPDAGAFQATFSRVHSASEQRYGRHSARYSSRGVWFATAPDGYYLAEDRVRFGHDPRPVVGWRAPLAAGIHRGVGDVVTLTASHLGLADAPYRIVEQRLDLESAAVAWTLEQARHRAWAFQGLVSSHNLVVRHAVATGSGHLLAIRESLQGGRVVRTDSAGVFQPLSTTATALLALDGNEVILGGPPSSGAGTGVLQRSSDGGSSSVVVHTLPAGMADVHELFEAPGGTLLASIGSGGILRSTDAGSTWALTDAISPAYHVRRFFRPFSGTLWGATGADDSGAAEGLHVWRSTDAGQSWAPEFSVYSSGIYLTTEVFAVTGSAFLLAHEGDGPAALGMVRTDHDGGGSAPDWTLVLSNAATARIHRTDSGHLLAGFEEAFTTAGGNVYRSTDAGSTWVEDGRLAKQGNACLLRGPGGTVDALVSRTSGGERTYRYRNHEPDEVP